MHHTMPLDVDHKLSSIDLKPLHMAEQLTLMDALLLSKINIREFLDENWTRDCKYEKSKNVCETVERFDVVVKWV
eukprot:UN32685